MHACCSARCRVVARCSVFFCIGSATHCQFSFTKHGHCAVLMLHSNATAATCSVSLSGAPIGAHLAILQGTHARSFACNGFCGCGGQQRPTALFRYTGPSLGTCSWYCHYLVSFVKRWNWHWHWHEDKTRHHKFIKVLIPEHNTHDRYLTIINPNGRVCRG